MQAIYLNAEWTIFNISMKNMYQFIFRCDQMKREKRKTQEHHAWLSLSIARRGNSTPHMKRERETYRHIESIEVNFGRIYTGCRSAELNY